MVENLLCLAYWQTGRVSRFKSTKQRTLVRAPPNYRSPLLRIRDK
ncbi:hypothetical protein VCR20J5_1240221 [Vibrio crassostreae]|uniref:Uncharacterized protein n=1 Tax=Vibrio crassostreae TaxID=246167 RepID=A0A822MY61_9VIBR|nr:hypothetical protein VCR20J5_1240221 [Vibrio crassostreae]CDT28298.1 hypothetical protein VCR5J5_230171 [Vibrio crassostreae]CDT35997.1 hypothetical protein VCR15J5_570166 [Vibrio crassostreae]